MVQGLLDLPEQEDDGDEEARHAHRPEDAHLQVVDEGHRLARDGAALISQGLERAVEDGGELLVDAERLEDGEGDGEEGHQGEERRVDEGGGAETEGQPMDVRDQDDEEPEEPDGESGLRRETVEVERPEPMMDEGVEAVPVGHGCRQRSRLARPPGGRVRVRIRRSWLAHALVVLGHEGGSPQRRARPGSPRRCRREVQYASTRGAG